MTWRAVRRARGREGGCAGGAAGREREARDDGAETVESVPIHLPKDVRAAVEVAAEVLDNWSTRLGQFVKVMPTDYKRVLLERKQAEKELVA